jgi:two-component system cell cycle response regulator CtrA
MEFSKSGRHLQISGSCANKRGAAVRILLVQGRPAEKISRTTLLESAGYVVDDVLDADEAFECLAVYEYDIVVLDRLPAKLDACKIIRRMRARHIDTPVLMLTAWVPHGIVVSALRAGADDVLTHPIADEELLARIEAIIRRRGGHAQSALQVGSLTIEMDSHDVIVGGRPMHLANKEFSVLLLLALRQGKLVTKEHIFNSLYNGLDDPQSRIIEVFICHLRKKLARIDADVTIETVHAVGYVLRGRTTGKTDPVFAHGARPPAAPVAGRRPMAGIAA